MKDKKIKPKKVVKIVKSSGKIKAKPLSEHIVEATNKGKPIETFFLIRWFKSIRSSIKLWRK